MLKFLRDNSYLDSSEKPSFHVYLILLNRPFHYDQLVLFYQKATCVICADGGANRLYDAMKNDEQR